MPITGGSSSASSSSTASVPMPMRVATTASTNAQVVKTGACTLASYQFFNRSVVPRYLRIYDMATTPDPATSTIKIGPITVPPNDQVSSPGGMSWAFSNGIAVTITGSPDDGDTTAIEAGDVNGVVGVL